MSKLPENFWIKVNKFGPVPATRPNLGPCWLWTASTSPDGYGKFGFQKKNVRVHKFAYEDARGAVPRGLELDHLCRVRNCCNPVHLEPVTRQENSRRGRAGAPRRELTHCPRGHAYSGDNLYTVPATGARHCQTCKRAAKRRGRAINTSLEDFAR